MDHQRQALNAGAVLIALSLLVRLIAGGLLQPLAALGESPGALSLLLYLQTGRTVRSAPAETVPTETETIETAPPETVAQETTPAALHFDGAEVENLYMIYGCSYRPDLQALLTQALDWNLRSEEPTVLILHTHTTESYEQTSGAEYVQEASYRTLDEDHNMLSIGDEVAEILEQGGVTVLHDRSYHDYPSYNGAYTDARATIQEYLQRYPSIRLVLDLHRDASDGVGGQLTTCATVGGETSSQLMIIVGTDAAGLYHPNWQENLALGLKLAAVLERSNPGVTKGVKLSSSRYNTDLTTGSLLIEVGAAGDSHDQALLAAQALARAILELANGSE